MHFRCGFCSLLPQQLHEKPKTAVKIQKQDMGRQGMAFFLYLTVAQPALAKHPQPLGRDAVCSAEHQAAQQSQLGRQRHQPYVGDLRAVAQLQVRQLRQLSQVLPQVIVRQLAAPSQRQVDQVLQ